MYKELIKVVNNGKFPKYHFLKVSFEPNLQASLSPAVSGPLFPLTHTSALQLCEHRFVEKNISICKDRRIIEYNARGLCSCLSPSQTFIGPSAQFCTMPLLSVEGWCVRTWQLTSFIFSHLSLCRILVLTDSILSLIQFAFSGAAHYTYHRTKECHAEVLPDI